MLDIVVFGATGYTGKFTLVQLYNLAKDISWGVAGRNKLKLIDILAETAKRVGVNDFIKIPILIADVEDEQSIQKMTSQTKLLINCCGPYDIYGDVVVKSCIETKTHYVDVTIEISFMERILSKYQKLAEENGVYIVNSCGFDSIPSDMGICFMENFIATLNSGELYASGTAIGSACNVGTWDTIINLDINAIMKMYGINTKSNQTKLPKPNLPLKYLHKVDNSWAIPLPAADEYIVSRSQQCFHKHIGKRPVQIRYYALTNSLLYVFLTLVLAILAFILAQFKYGRSFLLKYPKFFTYGLMTHLPSEYELNHVTFEITLKCRGWSYLPPEDEDQYQTPPNKEIIGRISGVNPAYGFTCLALTLSALMILKEVKNMPFKGGIYTPAVAFSKTSLVQQLQNNGVIFEVLSIKDISS